MIFFATIYFELVEGFNYPNFKRGLEIQELDIQQYLGYAFIFLIVVSFSVFLFIVFV
jgi:hypothetical protein